MHEKVCRFLVLAWSGFARVLKIRNEGQTQSIQSILFRLYLDTAVAMATSAIENDKKRARVEDGNGSGGSNGIISPLLSEVKAATLSFSSAFPSCSYQLFELPPELVDYVSSGGNLLIKGSKTEASDAVMCTNSKTFSVKKVETSNDGFILPRGAEKVDGSYCFEIESPTIHQFYEVYYHWASVVVRCGFICDILLSLLA
jgi:hypothetical protein